MSVSALIRDFLRFEAEENLFEETIDGVHFWERIRSNIEARIRHETGIHVNDSEIGSESVEEVSMSEDLSNKYRIVQNALFDAPIWESNVDVLFWGSGRREKQPNGNWWDIYFDPIIENIDAQSLYLEIPGSVPGHRTNPPVQTEQVRRLEFVRLFSWLLRQVRSGELSPEARKCTQEIEFEIERRFDTSVDVTGIVQEELAQRTARYPVYRLLLKRVDPTLVVLPPFRETFVEVCREFNIPVVKYQTVLPSRYATNIHYPGSRTKRTFADYFLSWGEFWSERIEYPIDRNQIYTVGYPHIERSRQRYSDVEESEQIVFLSQPTIGEQLSRTATELSERAIDAEIVYKVHPRESEVWRKAYPWLVDSEVQVAGHGMKPLYEIFAESTVQVGGYSTALFEGMYFGLETHIVDVPGTCHIEDLIERGHVTLNSDVDELYGNIAGDADIEPIDTAALFEPAASDKAADALSAILRREQDPTC